MNKSAKHPANKGVRIITTSFYTGLIVFLITGLCYGNVSYAQDSTIHKTDSTTYTSDSTTHINKVVPAVDTVPPVTKVRKHLYRMNYWTSGGFSILATAGNLYAIPHILHNKKLITEEELQALNPDIFNSIDKMAMNQDPAQRDKYKKISDYVLPAVAVSAAVLALDKNIRKDWVRILLMYYETHALMFSLYNFSFFGPAFQNKIRPVSYYSYFADIDRRAGNNRNSFFSGHTANVAAATYFMAKVYSDYHPELGGKKFLLYGLATVPPLIEGYFRIKALEHFPSDVFAGLVMGAVSGIIVPSLHRYRKHNNLKLDMTYIPMGGPGLGLSWIPENKKHKLLNSYAVHHTAVSLK
jgi:membrane-associated phospholipid phosphatase